MAGNPMVTRVACHFGGEGSLAEEMVRIGREKFIEQDNGQLMGLIGGRVLGGQMVQAQKRWFLSPSRWTFANGHGSEPS